jgi:hypothetical protein
MEARRVATIRAFRSKLTLDRFAEKSEAGHGPDRPSSLSCDSLSRA